MEKGRRSTILGRTSSLDIYERNPALKSIRAIRRIFAADLSESERENESKPPTKVTFAGVDGVERTESQDRPVNCASSIAKGSFSLEAEEGLALREDAVMFDSFHDCYTEEAGGNSGMPKSEDNRAHQLQSALDEVLFCVKECLREIKHKKHS